MISKTNSTHLSCLDGLRGWAALTVVLGHLTSNIYPFNSLLFSPLTDTKLAVSVFFVLSGFVLSFKLIDKPFSIREMSYILIARYVRLTIPIACVVLLVFVGLKLSLFQNVAASKASSVWNYERFYQFVPSIVDSLRFSVYSVYFNYDNAHTYIPPAWTMPVELLGSFLIYSVLFCSGALRSSRQRVILLIMLLMLSFLGVFIHFNYIFFFMYGYAMAYLYRSFSHLKHKVRLYLSQISTAVFCFVILASSLRSGDRQLALVLPVLAVSLVCSVILSSHLNAFFSNSLSKFLGKISFPLYLVHVPVYCSFSSCLFIWLTRFNLTEQQIYSIVFFASVSVSVLIARLLVPVEVFSINVSRRLKNSYKNNAYLSFLSIFRSDKAGNAS